MNNLLSFAYMTTASFAVSAAIFIGATSGARISRKELMTAFWICTALFIGCSVISGFMIFG